MPQVSFPINCTAVPPSEITELHPFGPSADGFHPDWSIRLQDPNNTPVFAITQGRLFTGGSNLFLQPFSIQTRRRGEREIEEEVETDLFDRLFDQPFVFCYKGVSISREMLDELFTTQEGRRGTPDFLASDELIQLFRDGRESVFVHSEDHIGYADEGALGLEIFFIANGIQEGMPGNKSGLDIIRERFTNPKTRRLDPVFFFTSVPNHERSNYPKIEDNENPVFARFTKRVLLEIRDEYDDYFIGEYGIQNEAKHFTEANHGMVSLMDAAPGVEPTLIDYVFNDTHHVFCRLPSGDTHTRTITRLNVRAPYHHATQRIYMHDSDDPRNWFTRNTLSRFTENNRVEYLIDGRATFRKMLEELNKVSGPGHYVRLTGWWLDTNFQLVPGSTLASVFANISEAGANINVLIWDNSTDLRGTCSSAVHLVNGLANGRGILVNTDPGFSGSQHQKLMVIKNRDGIVAFCGGVDINSDRLDDPRHTNPAAAGMQYHDTHAMVKGPAARELDKTFVHRWNAHVDWFEREFADHADEISIAPDTRMLIRLEPEGLMNVSITAHHTRYFFDPRPRLSVSAHDEYGTSTRGAFIQVTRTYPQRYAAEYHPYQPHGEVGTLNALKKAISRAKKYIYIEDQYLYPYAGEMSPGIELLLTADRFEEGFVRQTLERDRNGVGLLAALYDQLATNTNLCLVIVTSGANKYDQAGGKEETMLRMQFFVKMLRQSRTHVNDKIMFCYPKRGTQEIYVHSKLWIIDDVYVKIGSANCGRRSLTHDSEVDIHVISGSLQNGRRKFPRAFRKALWSEHLGIPNEERLDDIDYALWLWQNLDLISNCNAAYYPDIRIGATALPWSEIDPEGRSSPPTNPTIAPPLSSYD